MADDVPESPGARLRDCRMPQYFNVVAGPLPLIVLGRLMWHPVYIFVIVDAKLARESSKCQVWRAWAARIERTNRPCPCLSLAVDVS